MKMIVNFHGYTVDPRGSYFTFDCKFGNLFWKYVSVPDNSEIMDNFGEIMWEEVHLLFRKALLDQYRNIGEFLKIAERKDN